MWLLISIVWIVAGKAAYDTHVEHKKIINEMRARHAKEQKELDGYFASIRFWISVKTEDEIIAQEAVESLCNELGIKLQSEEEE
jgi:hypothetical protein